MDFLTVGDVSKHKDNAWILRDISFNQDRLQQVAIAGITGSGKTSLLKIISGLIQPDAGRVMLEGKRVLGPEEKLIPGHPDIAYLSQYFELRNNYRVEEILEYANTLSEEEAGKIFEVCRIMHLLKRKTDQLSGGEKQRIATARLLISSPKLMLLDEPFSNLDMAHKQIMKSVIHDIAEHLGITLTLVSHDPLDTLSWAHRILVMRDGKIVQQGSPEEVYRHPETEYVAGLFGKYNLIPKEKVGEFTHLHGLKPKGKDIMIRPEHFILVKGGTGNVKGRVVSSRFYGGYFEIDVMVGDTMITCSIRHSPAPEGDEVYIGLSHDAALNYIEHR